jgi:hypothetical protein
MNKIKTGGRDKERRLQKLSSGEVNKEGHARR